MAQPQVAALLQQSAAHKLWRVKVSGLLDSIMKTAGVLDSFIEKQKSSGDACSARLLEAKRGYDGLLKDTKTLTIQIDSHEEAMEDEQLDLSATMQSIKEVKEEHDEDIEKCEKEKKAALDEKAGF